MGKRQHARFKSVLPVRIWWVAPDGTRYSHLTHTLDINQYGARLGGVRHPLSVGDAVTLQYKQNRADFKVAWVGKTGTPTQHQVGLASVEPQKALWGELPVESYTDAYVSRMPASAATPPAPKPAPAPAQAATAAPAPPKPAPPGSDAAAAAAGKAPPPEAPAAAVTEAPPSPPAAQAPPQEGIKSEITRRLKYATEELCEIEELIKTGDVDPLVLAEFREALALARRTAWGVQQWFELKDRGDQPFPLLSFLTQERLVVATRLCQQLARDVTELSVAVEPGSMETLISAVEELAERLATLEFRAADATGKQATVEAELHATVAPIEEAPEPQPAEMESLVQHALMDTRADGVAVALTEGAEMVCRASAGIAPEAGVRWHAGGGLSGEALRTRQPVHCEDTESDPRVDPVLCQAANLRSCLIVPIVTRGGAKGTVEAYSSRPRAFSSEHVQSLTGVARTVVSMLKEPRPAESKASK